MTTGACAANARSSCSLELERDRVHASRGAEALGKAHEIGIGEVGAEETACIELLLVAPHVAEARVIEDDR